jgi:enamine deaminase RidA (YjgF/YER057c/UK114 family)
MWDMLEMMTRSAKGKLIQPKIYAEPYKYFFRSHVWEDLVGYSRAVRIGNIIEVSGTTSVDGDMLVGKDDL